MFGRNSLDDTYQMILEGRQELLAESLGELESRVSIFKQIVHLCQPIWPIYHHVATNQFYKLADVLLPEINDQHPLCSDIIEFIEAEQVKKLKIDAQLSYELLLLVGLPLMGFAGRPLRYDTTHDKYRSFTREMLLRIL